jgi:hypothetical protein
MARKQAEEEVKRMELRYILRPEVNKNQRFLIRKSCVLKPRVASTEKTKGSKKYNQRRSASKQKYDWIL